MRPLCVVHATFISKPAHGRRGQRSPGHRRDDLLAGQVDSDCARVRSARGWGVTVGKQSPADGSVERPGTDWMWELVVHALLAYDRAHDTEYFQGLDVEDVKVHEDRIDEFLTELALPAPVRADVLAWYAEHLWSPEAILAANRPYRGVLGVIRWFQLQPATCVALNTGRPEEIRDLTLQALNALGRAYRVTFRSDLLCMNPHGWGRR